MKKHTNLLISFLIISSIVSLFINEKLAFAKEYNKYVEKTKIESEETFDNSSFMTSINSAPVKDDLENNSFDIGVMENDINSEVIQPNCDNETISSTGAYSDGLSWNSPSIIGLDQTYNDSLENGDKYYQFSLDKAGSIKIEFDHDYGDTNNSWLVYVFNINDADNDLACWQFREDATVKQTSESLGISKGNYILKINRAYNFSVKPYAFRIKYTESPYWEREFNNTPVTATPVDVNNKYNGCLQYSYDKDYYVFELARPGYITISFDHIFIDHNYEYWLTYISQYSDINNDLLSKGFDGNATTTQYSPCLGLPAGKYVFLVKSNYNYSLTDYSFSLNYSQSDYWEKENNNDASIATIIEVNNNMYGSIQNAGDVDNYSFTLSQPGNIYVSFSHDLLSSSYKYWYIEIYNYNDLNTVLLTKGFSGNATQIVNTDKLLLNAGTYIIKITGAYDHTDVNYSFTVHSEINTVKVKGVSLPSTRSVKVGKTLTLNPEISPSNASDKKVFWKSSAKSVASVSDGVVTGITEGTADITVTTNDGGFSATCRVYVTKDGTDPRPDPDPSEEDLEKDIDVDATDLSFDMLPGEIRRLKINKTGKYVYGVSYVSSNPKTVSVKNGVVTAKNLKKGETEKKATVTATYNGESVSFFITVKAGIPAITLGGKGNKITAPKTVKADVGTSKTVTATVKLPKALQGKTVQSDKFDYGFFTLDKSASDPRGTLVSFKITPREAGATYIVWTVTDDSGNSSQAYTKVLIKKPLNKLSVSSAETGLDLSVGEGKRLLAATTIGNTDPKDLSFSVKGKGVKVSKSGYVTATFPGARADVTVKAGQYQKTVAVRVKDHTGSILALNKTSVNIKLPKMGATPKAAVLKVTMPKTDPPKVTWSIMDEPKGITVDSGGKVMVTSDASPGCYTVTATPEDPGSGYNQACCEVIVK